VVTLSFTASSLRLSLMVVLSLAMIAPGVSRGANTPPGRNVVAGKHADIFSGAARFRPFCDGNTTSDNFFRSLRLAAPQLSQSFFTKQECTQDPVPMHEWLGSQIPDTAPYIEWLAIVCSVMALLFAQSYSHMAS
jgi:hypothetical protein